VEVALLMLGEPLIEGHLLERRIEGVVGIGSLRSEGGGEESQDADHVVIMARREDGPG
jgi:hypothetical protein